MTDPNVIELVIEPRIRDIEGFSVGRILPFMKRRMVGPFIFLDHMLPTHFDANAGMDVRPHPHIGLATVTYLFDGEILHRDTLGSEQLISPGAVNWMTAGSGISHSERTAPPERARPHNIHGLQSWVALPKEHEEQAPEFFHHAAETLPFEKSAGVTLKVIAGSAYGMSAPVKTYSPLFYVEAKMEAESFLTLPEEYTERAAYLVSGSISINGTKILPHTLPVLLPGGTAVMTAETDSLVILLGGDPLPEKRFIWWNFVSSSEDRIVQAKEDWQQGRFGKIPGDDKEFVPLPVK